MNDQTSHGGSIVGPGALTVRIGGQPAAMVGDFAICPLSTGTPPNAVPHVGGSIITGSATVLIGGRPAARVGDTISETGSFATVLTGAATVIIGP
ncbi:MAG TPA: PAAR domain-containing protein [Gaiellaceae bacterium]